MRILVTGSRNWPATKRGVDVIYQAIRDVLINEPVPDWTEITIIHGACPTGADAIAAQWASDHDVRQETFPANWIERGKAAGPIRNQQMVDKGADICLAFPLGLSRGTRDCMRRAEKADIPLKCFEWAGVVPERQVPIERIGL